MYKKKIIKEVESNNSVIAPFIFNDYHLNSLQFNPRPFQKSQFRCKCVCILSETMFPLSHWVYYVDSSGGDKIIDFPITFVECMQLVFFLFLNSVLCYVLGKGRSDDSIRRFVYKA